MVCLAAVAFVVERLERHWKRFSLTSIAILLTSIGILLAFWRAQNDPSQAWFRIHDYVELDRDWWRDSAYCVHFGLGCAYYSCVWITFHAAAWFLTFLRRPRSREG